LILYLEYRTDQLCAEHKTSALYCTVPMNFNVSTSGLLGSWVSDLDLDLEHMCFTQTHVFDCPHFSVPIVFMGYLVAGSGDLDLDLDQRTGQLGAVHTCQPVLAIRKT
jgi:hypothetical protein